jgi:hypothetical protein
MSFDISRLRRSDQVIGGGAIALFIFLFFFKWYGASASTIGGVSVGGSLNGWHSFTDSRWIWLITIVVALGVVALTAAQREVSSPVQPSAIVAGLGALSTLLILYRIIHHPSGGASGGVGLTHFSYSYGIKIGIWLGLIAAAAITYGGYLAMQAQGISLADVREQASGAASTAFSGITAPAGASAPAAGASSAGSPGGSTAGSAPSHAPASSPAAPATPAPPMQPPATPTSTTQPPATPAPTQPPAEPPPAVGPPIPPPAGE